jgi:hypothetical protein
MNMSREQQRHSAVLQRRMRRALKKNYSTSADTIHYSGDELDTLLHDATDVEFFKDYPAQQRRRMGKTGQAMPDGSFPIADCSDAANAIHAIGRAAPEKRDRVKAHIRKRVRALRCSGSIYENWK